ncbi:MAG: hypothetical protein OXG87_04755 [Gemmatimonadetes bacterium]|nr:hypothetical protein [Gemmatimonadota bacterium]
MTESSSGEIPPHSNRPKTLVDERELYELKLTAQVHKLKTDIRNWILGILSGFAAIAALIVLFKGEEIIIETCKIILEDQIKEARAATDKVLAISDVLKDHATEITNTKLEIFDVRLNNKIDNFERVVQETEAEIKQLRDRLTMAKQASDSSRTQAIESFNKLKTSFADTAKKMRSEMRAEQESLRQEANKLSDHTRTIIEGAFAKLDYRGPHIMMENSTLSISVPHPDANTTFDHFVIEAKQLSQDPILLYIRITSLREDIIIGTLQDSVSVSPQNPFTISNRASKFEYELTVDEIQKKIVGHAVEVRWTYLTLRIISPRDAPRENLRLKN